MKTFKDIYLNRELEVDQNCYYNHDTYVYKGVTPEGKHTIELHKTDSVTTRFIDKKPFVAQIPLETYVTRNKYGKVLYGEVVGYTQMLEKLYYKVAIYSDVFNGYANETYEDLVSNWELVEENPFKGVDEFIDELDNIDSEINSLEDDLNSINREIVELKNKRNSITQYCKHSWVKFDEEEVSNKHFEQECECTLCGEKKINSYNKF